ncbi:hypothetical protein SteCoe_26205 [Stentor coeruleus]|uniref:Uncharacterized protein n=1 Tax=Stentor coeruleus TaxID=5963 RepID=A0A1R2BDG8_9CILI|nr:hypothetical protein SteCoe_26205 [Stentor coeruleus]
MHFFIVFTLILSLVSTSDEYLELEDNIGRNCLSTDYITIREFLVDPWPPQSCSSSFVTIKVEFNKPNFGVSVINYGTVNNRQQWVYEYQPIGEMFPQYSNETFEFLISWPKDYGNYITQVTFDGINMPPSINACWEFSYIIERNPDFLSD